MADILKPYIYRGDKNQFWFDSNALIIFDRIKQLKDEGLSLQDIVSGFKEEFKATVIRAQKNSASILPAQQCKVKNQDSSAIMANILQKMVDGRINALEIDKSKLDFEKKELLKRLYERERRIKEVERLNQEMKSQLKSLPYGRSPEQIRGDYETIQQLKKEKMRLLIELKNTGCLSILKRRRIINDLIELI